MLLKSLTVGGLTDAVGLLSSSLVASFLGLCQYLRRRRYPVAHGIVGTSQLLDSCNMPLSYGILLKQAPVKNFENFVQPCQRSVFFFGSFNGLQRNCAVGKKILIPNLASNFVHRWHDEYFFCLLRRR